MNERKLTDDQVREIRQWWAAYQEATKVPVPRIMAHRLGVCPATVRSVGQGFRYKEVQ